MEKHYRFHEFVIIHSFRAGIKKFSVSRNRNFYSGYSFTLIFIAILCLSLNAYGNPGYRVLSHKYGTNGLFRDSTFLNNAPENNTRILITPGMQNLFSTHMTDFTGESLMTDIRTSPNFWIGFGFENARCRLHYDNGYKLTDLKFQPVFLNFKLNLETFGRITPFLESSQGISFNQFDRIVIHSTRQPREISQRGIYWYTGTGFLIHLTKNIFPVVEAGFKGYHMSFNQLDINPHGFNLRLGLQYYFVKDN